MPTMFLFNGILVVQFCTTGQGEKTKYVGTEKTKYYLFYIQSWYDIIHRKSYGIFKKITRAKQTLYRI